MVKKNDIVLKSLCDSFEVLKDSWPSRKESLIDCIATTCVYDGSVAVDMWLYLLQNNESLLLTIEGVEDLVKEPLQRIYFKFNQRWCGNHYYCKQYLEHLVPYIIKNDIFIRQLFGKSLNGGFCNSNTDDEYIISIIACIFLSNNPQITKLTMETFLKNPLIFDVNIGNCMREIFDTIVDVYENRDSFKKKYTVSKEVKDVLLECLEFIEDKKDRAEFMIGLCRIE